MPGYAERMISLKTLCQRACSKYTPFFNQYAGKISLKVVYGWIAKKSNNQKRGKILFTYGVQCINKPTSKRYICMLQMSITIIMTAGLV